MADKKGGKGRKFEPWIQRVFVVFLFVILVLVGFYYLSINANNFPDWTGFPKFDPPANGIIREKTFWDWLDLLIVPGVIAIGIYLLNMVQKQREEAREEARRKQEEAREESRREQEDARQIDNQRQITLEKYLDKMTNLILEKGLGPDAEPEVKRLARTRIILVLRNLDAKRNRHVVQFLQESRLLDHTGDDPPGIKTGGVSLAGADLSGTDLVMVNLYKAHLLNVDLTEAKLYRANLKGANLYKAILNSADLVEADLTGADLSDASLDSTDLTNAIVSKDQLEKAILFTTILTDGSQTHFV